MYALHFSPKAVTLYREGSSEPNRKWIGMNNMVKRIYKTVVLIFIFAGALFLFGRNMETDMDETGSSVEMTEETYPYLQIQTQGHTINTLYGYHEPLDSNVVRESVTPLDQDKRIVLLLSKAPSRLINLEYSIIDKENGEVYSKETIHAIDENQRKVEIVFDYSFKTSTEYILDIKATSDQGKTIHYYTRLKYYLDESNFDKKLAFAAKFHKDTFTKSKEEELVRYLEPDSSNRNSTLAYVDITSSSDLVTWSGMSPKVISDELVTVKEYNMETACIQYNYFIQAATASGEETYQIKEFYRVRYASGQNYLLNFERSMEAVFDVNMASTKTSQLKLGITEDNDSRMLSNSKDNQLYFARGGVLYQYDMTQNQVKKIFSAFSDEASYNYRAYNEQGIRLLKVDDKDNLYFCAYGYFPRGRYEGNVAIILYEYTASGELEEMVYMPMSTTYQQLKVDFEEYGYVSSRGIYYFTVANTVYSYNMTGKRLEKIAENVKENTFMTMQGVNCYTWSSSLSKGYGESITIYNLENDEKKVIYRPDENSYVRLLGVIEDNMVYGFVRKADIGQMQDGTKVIPCYELYIASTTGEVKRKYSRKGQYIQKISCNGNVINMTLCNKKRNGFYEKTEEDTILNNTDKETSKFGYTSRVTTKSLTEWYIEFPASFDMSEQPKWGDPVTTLTTSERYVRLETPKLAKYYVYAGGQIVSSYESAAKAIREADERMGVVVSSNHQVVWERSGAFLQNSIGGLEITKAEKGVSNLEACIHMLLKANHYDVDAAALADEGQMPYEVLTRYLQRPVSLKGCTLDEILYFVSGNKPVIAMTGNRTAVVIGGYTSTQLTIYNPASGKKETVSRSAYENIFEKQGNHFVSYMTE